MSLTVLGFWLFAREATVDWRRRYRARRVQALLTGFEGRPVLRAEEVLGTPWEIVNGSAGRALYIWKGPHAKGIPVAATLLIVTLTVEADGRVSHAVFEER